MAVRCKVNSTLNTAGLARALDAAMDKGVSAAADQGLVEANDLVPMDEGNLRGSGRKDRNGDGDYSVIYDTPYAARLHEHPEYNFATDANPKAQGKWLEAAVVNNRRELGRIAAEGARLD